MLTYHLPAIRSSACVSVSVAAPSKESLSAPMIGTVTGPFLPAAAALKAAAVTGPLRPDTVPFHDSLLLSVSKVAITEPVPLLSFGGTSLDAFRSAFKSTIAAIDGAAHHSKAPQARAIRLNWVGLVICPPEYHGAFRYSKHCKANQSIPTRMLRSGSPYKLMPCITRRRAFCECS